MPADDTDAAFRSFDRFIDSGHPSVAAFAARVAGGEANTVAAAVRLY